MAPSLPDPCLCLVTDRRLAAGEDLVAKVTQAVEGGVDVVQLREKDLPGGLLWDLAVQIKKSIGTRALLLINERVDVAATMGADGVQLGEQALATEAARRLLGSGALIGRSVHSVEGAIRGEEEGADFLLVGTMFATSSHPGEEPAGPDLIAQIAATCSLPLLGIGGITHSNVDSVVAAGAQGVAAISSILAAENPARAARQMKEALISAAAVRRRAEGISSI